jgi:probable rRNA maturation factor
VNQLEIQIVSELPDLPDQRQIQLWIDTALEGYPHETEIVVRIVDEQESAELNQQYRHKSGPTNILSFPVDLPDDIGLNLLGDLVICAPVVAKEAKEQNKLLAHHWAHIVVHGVLHLLGYDHIDDADAEVMEDKEIAILNKLQIQNPYIEVI